MIEALVRTTDHIAARRSGVWAYDVLELGLAESEGGSWGNEESRVFQVTQWSNTKPRYAEFRAKLEAMKAAGNRNPKLHRPYELTDSKGSIIQQSVVSAKFTVDEAKLTRINDHTVREPMLLDADITVTIRPAGQRAVT